MSVVKLEIRHTIILISMLVDKNNSCSLNVTLNPWSTRNCAPRDIMFDFWYGSMISNVGSMICRRNRPARDGVDHQLAAGSGNDGVRTVHRG